VGKQIVLVREIARLISCREDAYSCGTCDNCVKIDKGVHPDLLVVTPEKRTIRIGQVKEGQNFLYAKSFQAEKKILVIDSAHCLTHEAAGAFLKTLEEPPLNCLIALVSSRADLLLPTILSRCRKIYLPYREEGLDGEGEDVVDFLERGKIYIGDRKSLSAFLLRLAQVLRDYLAFEIHKQTNKLINKNNYAIILKLNYSREQAVSKLRGVLKIYTAVDNINVNLACNLLKLIFG
jgi:hypothetical protein